MPKGWPNSAVGYIDRMLQAWKERREREDREYQGGRSGPVVIVRTATKKAVTGHGTIDQYSNHGCRCDRCREAMSAYYKQRAKLRAVIRNGHNKGNGSRGTRAWSTSRAEPWHGCFSGTSRQ